MRAPCSDGCAVAGREGIKRSRERGPKRRKVKTSKSQNAPIRTPTACPLRHTASPRVREGTNPSPKRERRDQRRNWGIEDGGRYRPIYRGCISLAEVLCRVRWFGGAGIGNSRKPKVENRNGDRGSDGATEARRHKGTKPQIVRAGFCEPDGVEGRKVKTERTRDKRRRGRGRPGRERDGIERGDSGYRIANRREE